MGVPTFYRWLCNRYPRVPKDVVDNYKDHKLDLSDSDAIGLELLLPNPNGEFDNLYLDMNGIIHPCCHPENMEQPESEEVMFRCILDYIDRIFFLVRPRKLIYLAIDGVAPRAKINQQRSRRFKSAAQADLEDETYEKLVKEYLENNKTSEIPIRPKKWDSNVITPGTEFMYKLSKRIVEYIKDRVERYDAWKRIVVIFSDSNVPGEGEHKIMKFIRNQRHCPGYDPNTAHVLHGMDADLIMLGLATHEPKFYIIREIITHFINTPNVPKINNNTNNNNNKENTKEDKENEKDREETKKENKEEKEDDLFRDNEKEKDNNRNKMLVVTKTGNLSKDDKYMRMMRENWRPLQLLQLSILREYLSYQLKFVGGFDDGSSIDFERCIDDVVLMIFFCGNDFLPNLPSISITGGSIDQMLLLYQKLLPSLNDYLSNEGNLNFKAVDKFFKYLSKIEDDTFRSMHEYRMRFQNNNNNKENTKEDTENNNTNNKENTKEDTENNNTNNKENKETKEEKEKEEKTFKELFKETMDKLNASDDVKPMVDVTLNDSTLWKKAYYFEKFGVEDEEELPGFVEKVSFDYIQGICWVLQYYYQGCASWSWYYPHHYSPFCSDLDFSCVYSDETEDNNNNKENTKEEYTNNKESVKTKEQKEEKEERGTKRPLDKLKMVKFDLAKPLTPFQQLMGVMPIRSSHCIPKQLRVLMTDPESPLRHFYPVKFKEDPNGKRYKYQWVALLPFIDEEKLLLHVEPIEEQLSDEEKYRNRTSENIIFISKVNRTRFLNKINQIIDKNKGNTNNNNNKENTNKDREERKEKEKTNKETKGQNTKEDKEKEGEPEYFISECNKKHRSVLMEGVELPPKVLTVQDVMEEQRNRGFNCEVAKRMILNMLSSNKELHYDEPSETVLKDTARDYHQYQNQYNPQQYTPNQYTSNQYTSKPYYNTQGEQQQQTQTHYSSTNTYGNQQQTQQNQYSNTNTYQQQTQQTQYSDTNTYQQQYANKPYYNPQQYTANQYTSKPYYNQSTQYSDQNTQYSSQSGQYSNQSTQYSNQGYYNQQQYYNTQTGQYQQPLQGYGAQLQYGMNQQYQQQYPSTYGNPPYQQQYTSAYGNPQQYQQQYPNQNTQYSTQNTQFSTQQPYPNKQYSNQTYYNQQYYPKHYSKPSMYRPRFSNKHYYNPELYNKNPSNKNTNTDQQQLKRSSNEKYY